MRRQSIARSDVSSLSVPTQISVPESIEETTALLDDVGGALGNGGMCVGVYGRSAGIKSASEKSF